MSYRVTVNDDLTFEPPGPGTWMLIDGHFPRPLSRYYCTINGEPMEEGYNQAAARFGGLIERETAVINRFYYMAQQPIDQHNPGVADGVSFDERVDRLRETYEQRAWHQTVNQWDEEWKPSVREAGRELIEVDPASLTDEALIDHLDICRSITWDAHVFHFRVLPPMGLAVGDFLAHAADLTGRPEGELLRLLDGSSPASAGLDDELSRVERTIKSNPAAEAILFGEDLPGTIIDRLRQRPGEVGQAIKGWLCIAGYRTVSGYDIADSYALEQPEVLVRTIRSAVREGVDAPNTSPDQELVAIRESLSSNEREGFDDRLSEARAVYRVRDESSLLGLWAQGILRRGLLAAGRRLADRGLLHDSEHVVELTHRELLAALRGETVPSADEVASYVEFRLTYDSDDAPDELGSERSPPSDDESETSVPDPVARMRKGRQAVMQAWNLGHEKAEETSPKTIDGLAASPGTYEGKARIVTDPDNFSAIEDGDVLVAEMTSSAFNVVLPLLGAIVTDKGGMLAHPAIVAREFGIPAVVSCEDATHEINNGDQLVVDGDEGKVQIVE